jgi:hypothetical protein
LTFLLEHPVFNGISEELAGSLSKGCVIHEE